MHKFFLSALAVSALLAWPLFSRADTVVPDFDEQFAKAKKTAEFQCMALNIYHEARGDNRAGKFAVADVVLNRVADERYPDSVCGVVKQSKRDEKGNLILNKCQFSWWCDGKSDTPREVLSWEESQLVAFNIMYWKRFRGLTEGSTHYHAVSIPAPYWAKDFISRGVVGQHQFYQWENI